jgi:hypothetical protein
MRSDTHLDDWNGTMCIRSPRKLNEIMEELVPRIRNALNHRDGDTIYRSVLKRTIVWVFLSSDSGSL